MNIIRAIVFILDVIQKIMFLKRKEQLPKETKNALVTRRTTELECFINNDCLPTESKESPDLVDRQQRDETVQGQKPLRNGGNSDQV